MDLDDPSIIKRLGAEGCTDPDLGGGGGCRFCGLPEPADHEHDEQAKHTHRDGGDDQGAFGGCVIGRGRGVCAGRRFEGAVVGIVEHGLNSDLDWREPDDTPGLVLLIDPGAEGREIGGAREVGLVNEGDGAGEAVAVEGDRGFNSIADLEFGFIDERLDRLDRDPLGVGDGQGCAEDLGRIEFGPIQGESDLHIGGGVRDGALVVGRIERVGRLAARTEPE